MFDDNMIDVSMFTVMGKMKHYLGEYNACIDFADESSSPTEVYGWEEAAAHYQDEYRHLCKLYTDDIIAEMAAI